MTAPSTETRFCTQGSLEAFAREHNLTCEAALRQLLASNVWPEHFRRNQGLLTSAEQLKLVDLPIFIAGCGGLGGDMAASLVQLGAGNLYLCDYDVFEESNLNRQRFCDFDAIGKPKAEITAKALRAKAPWGRFTPLLNRLEKNSFPREFYSAAIVVDCLDSIQGKLMLEQAAMEAQKPWLYGAVLHLEAFACLSPAPFGLIKSLYGDNCAESGAGSILTHTVSGAAALMTSLFIRWLKDPTYKSLLLHADFSIPELERLPIA